jgi:hypothetical protein
MWGEQLMEHVVTTTVTVVTGNRKEVTDLALGLVMINWHTVDLLPGGDLAMSRANIATKGTNREDLKVNLGVEQRITP